MRPLENGIRHHQSVFIIGAAVLWLEFWRQSRKADEKQQEEDNYFKSLSDNVTNLNIMVERQDAQLRELNRHVLSLHGQMYGIKGAVREG